MGLFFEPKQGIIPGNARVANTAGGSERNPTLRLSGVLVTSERNSEELVPHASVVHSNYARVVELVDTHALGACAFGREGSSPFSRTMILFINRKPQVIGVFYLGDSRLTRRFITVNALLMYTSVVSMRIFRPWASAILMPRLIAKIIRSFGTHACIGI